MQAIVDEHRIRNDLTGRKALVIGGSRGIGAAIAVALAGAGADVAITSRTVQAGGPVEQAITAMGRRALSVACDVTRPADLEELVATVYRELGGLDVLVHSAGTSPTRPALEITEEDWDTVLDLNLRSAFFAARAAARRMKEAGGGSIIFVSSIMGLVAESQVAPYVASKSGLNGLTRALALEWARLGINVNALAPGYILTALNQELFANPKVLQRAIDRTPQRRLGEPEDVCGAALLLAGPAGRYITGQVLVIDGGWTIQ